MKKFDKTYLAEISAARLKVDGDPKWYDAVKQVRKQEMEDALKAVLKVAIWAFVVDLEQGRDVALVLSELEKVRKAVREIQALSVGGLRDHRGEDHLTKLAPGW